MTGTRRPGTLIVRFVPTDKPLIPYGPPLDTRPGEHRWLLVAAYTVDPAAVRLATSTGDPLIMGPTQVQEVGIGCAECGKRWSDRDSHRACTGRIDG